MKQRESKLDQYADVLAAMDSEKKTLPEIVAWLKQEGVTCSLSTVSRFLEAQRQERVQKQLLGQITTAADQCQAVEKQFSRNPAPQMETLIKLHRVLILKLSTMGNVEPEFLKLADQLMRTAMEFVSGQTKFAQKERELRLAEDKFQIEFCELVLTKAVREAAERIAASDLSQADKISAMRKAAFTDVEALKQKGIQIPRA